MFKPRSSDLQKSSSKLSDTKKDLKTRMRHLRVILDHSNAKESKRALGEDTEDVFGLFVEYFQALDLALRQRGQKVNKEDVETVLYALEKILLLLPEFIRTDPPQASVIITVLKRCLHPSSTLRLRRDAMRPFLIYYQILRESCSEELHHLFMLLIPGLYGHVPNTQSTRDQENSDLRDIFESAPPLLLPPAGEKPPENLTRLMYETLLDLLVSQVYRICWDDVDQYQASFTFLFEKFKTGYLSRVFPESRACIIPVKGFYPASIEGTTSTSVDAVTLSLQIATMKWLITFLQSPDSLKVDSTTEAKKRVRDNSVGSDSVDSGLVVTKNRESSGSFSAAFQNLLHLEVNLPAGNLDGRSKPIYGSNVYLMVRQTLLSSSSNIQLVHELFETALKFPLTEHGVIKRVVAVYESWISAVELSKNTHAVDTVDALSSQQGFPNFAADQSTLKLFCVCSVHPFRINLGTSDYSPNDKAKLLEEQEKICERIIFLYRCAILKLPMSLSTWECILNTLIKVTQICMPPDPPKNRLSTLCGRLSVSLFQTLLVAWVKGTLSAYIAPRLWDDLTDVLSTLTAWEELIVRWEKTLVLITKLFAEQVFNVKYDSISGEHGGNSFASNNQESDDGTLVPEPPRCRSNASSSDTEGISMHFNGRNDHESGSVKSGSMEPEEYGSSPKDRDGTLKQVEEAFSRRLRHVSGSGEDNDGTVSNSDNFIDTSRSDSTPDSLRESLSSPLFYPLEFDRKRAASSCSWVSVMAGGQLQGWSPDSACALWFRVFGVIGPVNKISNPVSHKFALESVNRIVDMLLTVYDKKGISTDSLKGELTAYDRFVPVAIVAPLLFEALSLPESYLSSQALALQIICDMTFHAHPIPKKFCMHLIRTFHCTLLSGNQTFIEVIIRNAGMRLFCSKVPNAFLLLEDFAVAAQSLVDSKNHELQLMSIHMLGSLLFYLRRLPASFTVLSPIADTFKLKPCHNSEVQAKIFTVILRYTNITCPSDVRIPAFHCAGNVLYSLLNGQIDKPNIVEMFLGEILKATENFSGDGVSEIVNILLMISNHAATLFGCIPRMIYKIVESVCTLVRKMAAETAASTSLSREFEDVFVKLILCLCEWIIAVPALLSEERPLLEDASTIRVLVEQTLDTVTHLPDALPAEQEDPVIGANLEIKGKGRRGFSDLLTDRRFSADVGTVTAARNLGDDDQPMTRRATSNFFSRPVSDAPKEKKTVAPRPDGAPQSAGSSRLRVLKLAGAYAARHIVNKFCSVPNEEAWALMSSIVSEEDDILSGSNVTDNLQVFSIYDMIISLRLMNRSDLSTEKDFHAFPVVRVLARDIAGKYCYDICSLFGDENLIDDLYETPTLRARETKKNEGEQETTPPEIPSTETADRSLAPAIHTYDELVRNHSADVMLDIMKYVETTTPGLGLSTEHPWNEPGPPPAGISTQEESNASEIMLLQHQSAKEYVEQKRKDDQLFAPVARPPAYSLPQSAFGYCSRILSQFGYAGMGKRQHFHLMKRTDAMFRDLKLLDKRPNRDFQKIAVIYIARGQEDKMSIMTNNGGSDAYERFVNRLGWNVDLADHKGFRGGLPQNSWQFSSAVYFASATLEVIFHVATRVGALTTEDHTSKMKHIGNDEVQIIWSDHYRDYDRKIMPTQFGDVIICIYPTEPKGLYRVQIIRREHVPPFGPLYDGAIVDEENLAGLVRNTALNAGQACRKSIKGFQYFFEERAEYLKSLIQNYTEEGTYEHFLSSIISPQPPKLNIPSAPNRDVPVMMRPSWRESTRRYNDKVRNSLQTKNLTVKDADFAGVSLRYSLPPRSGSTSSGTDV